jgi:hypothetical protein
VFWGAKRCPIAELTKKTTKTMRPKRTIQAAVVLMAQAGGGRESECQTLSGSFEAD